MTDIIERLESILVIGTPKPMIIGMVIDEIKSLRQQLADADSQCELSYAGIRSLEQKLVECQAREKVLRNAMIAVLCDPEGTPCFEGSDGDRKVITEALAMHGGCTALDEAIKQVKREALLEAADYCADKQKQLLAEYEGGYAIGVSIIENDFRRMAEELK